MNPGYGDLNFAKISAQPDQIPSGSKNGTARFNRAGAMGVYDVERLEHHNTGSSEAKSARYKTNTLPKTESSGSHNYARFEDNNIFKENSQEPFKQIHFGNQGTYVPDRQRSPISAYQPSLLKS